MARKGAEEQEREAGGWGLKFPCRAQAKTEPGRETLEEWLKASPGGPRRTLAVKAFPKGDILRMAPEASADPESGKKAVCCTQDKSLQ